MSRADGRSAATGEDAGTGCACTPFGLDSNSRMRGARSIGPAPRNFAGVCPELPAQSAFDSSPREGFDVSQRCPRLRHRNPYTRSAPLLRCAASRANRARARARSKDPMNELDHEKLDVSVAWADEVVERLPRGRVPRADQLQRSATSIALTIAEGAGECPTNDTARVSRHATALGHRIRRHRARLRASHADRSCSRSRRP
jgi:hypothetical protein